MIDETIVPFEDCDRGLNRAPRISENEVLSDLLRAKAMVLIWPTVATL